MSLVARCLLISLLLAAVGCSAPKSQEASSGKDAAPAAGGGTATVSKYDSGPRAAATPVDEEQAEQGAKLFQTKGCSACHAFGKRVTGPDLAGVTSRRTAEWMQNQILHPDVMTKEDPISHGLLAQYALQMPNQGLTPDEAKAVIEFFKEQDKKLAEKH